MIARPSLRGLMLAGATVTGIIWIIGWGLLQGWYPEAQRKLILVALDRGLGIDAELAAARGSLVDGLELDDLVLRPRGEASADPSQLPFAADRVEISLDLTRVLEEQLVIVKSLVVEGVALRLQQDEERNWQLFGWSTPQTVRPDDDVEETSFRVEVQDIAVRNASLTTRWHDLEGPGFLVAIGTMTARDLTWPSIDGQILPSVLAGDFRVREGELGPVVLTSGRLKVSVTQNRMQANLERATAGAPALGRFHLSGQATVEVEHAEPKLTSLDARLAFSRFNLASIPTKLELPESALNGELHVRLKDAAMQIVEAELVLDPSDLAPGNLDSGRARLRYGHKEGTWALVDAAVKASTSELRANGSGTLEHIEALAIDALDLPLDDIAVAAGIEVPVEGRVNFSASLSGPVGDPVGELFVEGAVMIDSRPLVDFGIDLHALGNRHYRIKRLDLSTEAESKLQVALASPALLQVDNETFLVTGVDLRGLSGSVNVASASSDGRTHRLDLQFEELDLLPITSFLASDRAFEGQLSGTLNLLQRKDDIRVETDLQLLEPRYGAFATKEITLHTSTRDSLVEFSGVVDWGATSSVEFTGALPGPAIGESLNEIATDPQFAIGLSVRDLPAREVTGLVDVAEDSSWVLEGTLAGEFNAKGSTAGPVVSCSGRWRDAHFGTAAADNVNVSCRTEANQLRIDLEISNRGRNGFVADASIDLVNLLEQPDGLLLNSKNHATLRAQDIDLAWLIPRASARRLGRINAVRGTATGEVEVRGGENGPQVDGELNVNGAELDLALVDEKIGPIDGRLLFTRNEIRAKRVEIASTKGPAVLNGHYRYGTAGRDHLKLRARFKKFALTHFSQLDARVDGELRLNGSLQALEADGELEFSRVHVNLPAPEDPLLREVRILGLEGDNAQAQDPLGRAAPSAYQNMQANIDIEVRPGAVIRERGVDAKAEGQFRLRKKRLASAVLQGNLRTAGGTYTFLGKKFDLSEGVAIFEERSPPDPELQLHATRHIGDVTVGIQLTGRWSDRHSRLTSVPEMDENEILSYLVFDKPISEVGDGDDQQLNAVAAQLAGNLALSQLAHAISDELPINEITVDVDEDMTVSSVGVETNVGDDIVLRYDRSLQAGVGDRLTVEWRFWKNLSLRSEYANGDTSGLDLFWSYEY